MFRWLWSKRKLIEVEEGENGNWRWYARVDGEIVAQSCVSGHPDSYRANQERRRYIKGLWPVVYRRYKRG